MMFGLHFDLVQAVNLTVAVVLGGLISAIVAVVIARPAATRSETAMLQTAKAFEVVARHLHQAFRDPDSVGELNLDDVGFPVGITHKVKSAATATDEPTLKTKKIEAGE